MEKTNQIIIALDDDINEGLKLLEMISKDKSLQKMIYGVKVGSLWVLQRSISIVKEVRNKVWDECIVMLDMQKWPTDIPDFVKKQVSIVAGTNSIQELVACPMGGGKKSLQAFVESCKNNGIRSICVLEMSHPDCDSYLKPAYFKYILYDAGSFGIDGFIIPATKEPRLEIKWHLETAFPNLKYELYSLGFNIQGGQIEDMRKFGVSKYIIGRSIYEAEDPICSIKSIYGEINGIINLL
jgi:orotidine-5'-phosphate decarboxylase